MMKQDWKYTFWNICLSFSGSKNELNQRFTDFLLNQLTVSNSCICANATWACTFFINSSRCWGDKFCSWLASMTLLCKGEFFQIFFFYLLTNRPEIYFEITQPKISIISNPQRVVKKVAKTFLDSQVFDMLENNTVFEDIFDDEIFKIVVSI